MTFHSEIEAVRVLELRRATLNDRESLEELREQSMQHLLDPLMSKAQQRTMRRYAPVDERLISDGTYYVVCVDDLIAASGGWSRRAALYSERGNKSDHDRLLDPKTDSAAIRAMFTHPRFSRLGLGTLIMAAAESAARIAGFRTAELIATLAGEKLYAARGWRVEERIIVGPQDDTGVPGSRMTRRLT